MATMKQIKDLVAFFLPMATRNMTPKDVSYLEDAYFAAFKAVPDGVLKTAAYAYMEEGEFFPPKPANLRKFVKGSAEAKHIRELIEAWTCSVCHQKVHSILTEKGTCADCAGLPPVASSSVKLPEWNPINYTMEGRIKCQSCGAIMSCIKEPRDSGAWKCQQCYTGLNKQEIAQRFNDLERMVFDKDFKPKWVKALEVPF